MRQEDIERILQSVRQRYQMRMDALTNEDGGPGSGNWGHAGRKGIRGGSAPGSGNKKNRLAVRGGGFTSVSQQRKLERQEMREQGVVNISRKLELVLQGKRNPFLKLNEHDMFKKLGDYDDYMSKKAGQLVDDVKSAEKELSMLPNDSPKRKALEEEVKSLNEQWKVAYERSIKAHSDTNRMWRITEQMQRMEKMAQQEKKSGEGVFNEGHILNTKADRQAVQQVRSEARDAVKEALGMRGFGAKSDIVGKGKVELQEEAKNLQDAVKQIRKQLEDAGIKTGFPVTFKEQKEDRSGGRYSSYKAVMPERVLMKISTPEGFRHLLRISSTGGGKSGTGGKTYDLLMSDIATLNGYLFDIEHDDPKNHIIKTEGDW